MDLHFPNILLSLIPPTPIPVFGRCLGIQCSLEIDHMNISDILGVWPFTLALGTKILKGNHLGCKCKGTPNASPHTADNT